LTTTLEQENLTVSFHPLQAKMAALLTLRTAAFVILAALSGLVGSATALVWVPSDQTRSAIQHFAAGVVYSVVAVELLPGLTATHAIPEVIGGFLAGVILLMMIRAKVGEQEEKLVKRHSRFATAQNVPVGLLTGIGIDVFLDGLLLGLGISLGAKEGLLLAAALSLELYSLGLALGVDMRSRQLGRTTVLLASTLVGTLLVAGTAVGFLLLSSGSPHVLAFVLSFGCAALLFLVTEELLVEAHEVPETIVTTGSFFGGFLLFLVLGMAL
jgi:ZIP family zinc transporter